MKKMLPLLVAGLFGLSSAAAMAASVTAPAKSTESVQVVHKTPATKNVHKKHHKAAAQPVTQQAQTAKVHKKAAATPVKKAA